MPGVDAVDLDRPPWWDPGQDASVDPDTDEILVAGVSVRRGVPVRLRPGARRVTGSSRSGVRRTDAQDLVLDDRLAHVEAVRHDVDGSTHLTVALEELVEDGVNPHGRFQYIAPDEIELPVQI